MAHTAFRTLFASLTIGLAFVACGDEGGEIAAETSDVQELPFAEGSHEALAVLSLVNDRAAVTEPILDVDAALDVRAAGGIIAHRDGPDAMPYTADDDLFDTLTELDLVSWVGPSAMHKLLDYATIHGYLDAQLAKQRDLSFSPQAYHDSHVIRIAELIDQAEHSLDIAMYSYSDAGIGDAIGRATDRGVKVRFVFETGNGDSKKTGTDLQNSKSGKLEQMGVNVRYINKIMHHKYMIVDGPRDDFERAKTARIVTGSGNWSYGAATMYDENTLFLTAYPELALRLQREFDYMWEHSRDVEADPALPYELATLSITEEMVPEDPGMHIYFTSANFKVNDTTFSVNGSNEVSDRLVAAIQGATKSIHVMSGHLRSRPIAEAIMAKTQENPELDVRVVLDGQEYISSWYHGQQLYKLDNCLDAAGTSESKIRNCMDKGFYFGYILGQAGADVRYKYYAYRWHYSYALQMHNKVMIIDGDELWTGSYNLSDNAEHNTFENMFLFRGPEFRDLVAEYEMRFDYLWELGRAENLLAQVTEQVATAPEIPLVFDPMSLSWQEVTDLKSLIRANCADINSEDFRKNPDDHFTCPR